MVYTPQVIDSNGRPECMLAENLNVLFCFAVLCQSWCAWTNYVISHTWTTPNVHILMFLPEIFCEIFCSYQAAKLYFSANELVVLFHWICYKFCNLLQEKDIQTWLLWNCGSFATSVPYLFSSRFQVCKEIRWKVSN